MPSPIHKLTIRREQADLFAEDAWQAYVQKLLQHTRLVFPTFIAPFADDDEAMRRMLLPLVEEGRSLGIEYEHALMRYVDIQLFFRFYAREVGDPAPLQKELRNTSLPPAYRVDRVFEYLEQRFADIEHGRTPKAFTP